MSPIPHTKSDQIRRNEEGSSPFRDRGKELGSRAPAADETLAVAAAAARAPREARGGRVGGSPGAVAWTGRFSDGGLGREEEGLDEGGGSGCGAAGPGAEAAGVGGLELGVALVCARNGSVRSVSFDSFPFGLSLRACVPRFVYVYKSNLMGGNSIRNVVLFLEVGNKIEIYSFFEESWPSSCRVMWGFHISVRGRRAAHGKRSSLCPFPRPTPQQRRRRIVYSYIRPEG